MNIQIYGTKKCKATQKAQRFFKERRINFQFIDLNVKGMSKGEINKVAANVGLENMIDKESKQYEKRNLKYIVHDILTELMEDPLLLKTPVVRNGNKATIGLDTETWKSWE
jgi:arsenate reductase-like glutaredoxin family protein